MLMSMRSISAAEAGCSTGSTLLHQLHHVVGAIPLQLFLDLDSDETNGVVLQRDHNRHVLQLPSGRRGQHRQLSPECQRHVGEGRTLFGLHARGLRNPLYPELPSSLLPCILGCVVACSDERGR